MLTTCRNLRKVNILLQAIDRLGKDVEYYAVDLSLPELERTFSEIPTGKYPSLIQYKATKVKPDDAGHLIHVCRAHTL